MAARMSLDKLGKSLGLGVLAIAVLFTVSAASMPIRDSRASAPLIAVWAALLLVHAAMYWFGVEVRSRFSLGTYAVVQAALVFALGVSGALIQLVVALYIVLIAEIIRLAEGRWSSVSITM